jgi:hypothetical protein
MGGCAVVLSALASLAIGVAGTVSKGNHQALAEFVAAVNDQISLEHGQWLEATEATREAMAKLDEALAAMQPPGVRRAAGQPVGNRQERPQTSRANNSGTLRRATDRSLFVRQQG